MPLWSSRPGVSQLYILGSLLLPESIRNSWRWNGYFPHPPIWARKVFFSIFSPSWCFSYDFLWGKDSVALKIVGIWQRQSSLFCFKDKKSQAPTILSFQKDATGEWKILNQNLSQTPYTLTFDIVPWWTPHCWENLFSMMFVRSSWKELS